MTVALTFWERLIDRQVVLVGAIVLLLLAITFFLGDALFPFFAAAVIAYLLDGMVRIMEQKRIPRTIAVLVVFGLFMTGLFALFLWLIPFLAKQLTAFAAEVPRIMQAMQKALIALQEKYLSSIQIQFLNDLIPPITRQAEAAVGQLASKSIHYLPGLIGLTIYLILVPFLVIFFLLDKHIILPWLIKFLPQRHELLFHVLRDVDQQIGHYLRGRFLEVIVITMATSFTFILLDVRFAVLLGILAGLSTLVPYLGQAVVTVLVVALVLVQWGFTWAAMKPIIAYMIVEILDGNVLAPLILGISVNVHPTAIIFAILVCGSIWGYWGVFFGVPIAIVVKSLLDLAFPYIRGQSPLPPAGEAIQEDKILQGRTS
jgi:putative permease